MDLIDFKIPDADLAALRRDLDPQQFKLATWAIVQRGVSAIRTAVKRRVAEQIDVKKEVLDDAIKTRIEKGEVPVGWVTVSGKRLTMNDLKPRVTKRGGVTVKLPSKDGKGKEVTLKHAFRATVGKGGHVGIFLRTKHLPSEGGNSQGYELRPRKSMGPGARLSTGPGFARTAPGMPVEPMPAGHGRRLKHRTVPGVPVKDGFYATHIKLTPKGFAGRLSIQEETLASLPDVVDIEATAKLIDMDIDELVQKLIASQRNRFGVAPIATATESSDE